MTWPLEYQRASHDFEQFMLAARDEVDAQLSDPRLHADLYVGKSYNRGRLAWAARQGLTVRILGVTRGQGGEVGDPPVTTQERLGETREAELRCAGEALGVASVAFREETMPAI